MKIICIGRNYADHAKEFGGGVPDEPVLFMKATTACCGPFDDVILPAGSKKLDYEVERADPPFCSAPISLLAHSGPGGRYS